jgi:hypothetical protein
MKSLTINHLAVLICVVLGQVIPLLWFTLFSDQWMALSGITLEQAEANQSPVPYLSSMASAALVAYTIAWLFTKIPVHNARNGLLAGLLFGTVFVLSETIVKDMFQFHSFLLSLINGGVGVVVYAVYGLVLGALPKYQSEATSAH